MNKKIVKKAAAPKRYNDAIRVDEEPITNSDALLTSGGTAAALYPLCLKPTILDFSGWSSGSFVETLDDDFVNAFEVEFDNQNRPVKFTDSSGHETVVIWDT